MDTTTDPLVFPAPTDEERAALRSAHKRLYEFSPAKHTVLCRKMPRITWDRIQAAQKDPESKEDITALILTDTLVYPSRAKMEDLLEEFPACFEVIALDIIALAKGDDAKRGKRV